MGTKIDDGLTNNQRYYRRRQQADPSYNAERTRRWREQNPEYNAEKCREAYWRTPEAKREYAATWMKAKRETSKPTEDMRLRDRLRKQLRRARKANAAATLTKQDWLDILQQFNYRCAYCGTGGALAQDHVKPLSRGGQHTRENIVPSCRPCNSSKGAWTDRPRRLSSGSGAEAEGT